MLDYTGGSGLLTPNARRKVTVFRGQKDYYDGMVIEASSLRCSGGSRTEQEAWTRALITQFRRNSARSVSGDLDSRKKLEGMPLNAQQFAFQNPFVSTSFSYSVARSFATAGDTPGYALTIEGPWYNGIDFDFQRNLFGLYGNAFDYLQEFGIPTSLVPPYTVADSQLVNP